MRRSMTQKIICSVVAFLFFVNDICFGLGVMPGSDVPETKDAMYALGQKLLGVKRPGTLDFDDRIPEAFMDYFPLSIEKTIPEIKFIEPNYSNPPKGWENNPILQKTDLIEALEYFRDNEACIPAEELKVTRGYFPVRKSKGEFPMTRIEYNKATGERTLVVHEKFVQMWNDIRTHDVWFEMPVNGQMRTVSVAYGIFYRLAKHEMSDLAQSGLEPKNVGHITYTPDRGLDLSISKDELSANDIRGRYEFPNNAIWMWFLGSYCFNNSTRYNNRALGERLNWFFTGEEARKMGLDKEFVIPGLAEGSAPVLDIALACAINYHFFNDLKKVPELKVGEKYIDEYKKREGSISDVIYATGAGKTQPAPQAAKAKVKVLFADDPADPETLNSIRKELFERFGSDVELIKDHGEGNTEGWLSEQIKKHKPDVIIVRSTTNDFKAPKDPKGPASPIFKIAQENGVKLILRAGAGIDNINAEEARKRGIAVARTGGNANSVADLTLLFLAALGKMRPVVEQIKPISASSNIDQVVKTTTDEYLELIAKSKKWVKGFTDDQIDETKNRWKKDIFDPVSENEIALLAQALEGRTIGLLGFGPVAQAVAQKLQMVRELTGASFNVIAYSQSLKEDDPRLQGLDVTPVTRKELFERSDIVSIHLPGLKELALTREELKSPNLKAVINTSRSVLADPGLLKTFVAKDGIYLADLDIDTELQSLMDSNRKNVVVLPHIGASTADAAAGVEKNTGDALTEAVSVLLGRGNPSKKPVLDIVNDVKLKPVVSKGLAKRVSRTGRAPASTKPDKSPEDALDEKVFIDTIKRAVVLPDNRELLKAAISAAEAIKESGIYSEEVINTLKLAALQNMFDVTDGSARDIFFIPILTALARNLEEVEATLAQLLLTDKNEYVRSAAARGVAFRFENPVYYGYTIEALRKGAEDPNTYISNPCKNALERAGAVESAEIVKLREDLKSEDMTTLANACERAYHYGDNAIQFIPRLVELLKEHMDDSIGRGAVLSLRNFGIYSIGALPLLADVADKTKSGVTLAWAVSAIEGIKSKAESYGTDDETKILESDLWSSDNTTVANALERAHKKGDKAVRFIPILVDAASRYESSTNLIFLLGAVRSLRGLGLYSIAAVPLLRKIAEREEKGNLLLRDEALKAVAEIEQAAQAIVSRASANTKPGKSEDVGVKSGAAKFGDSASASGDRNAENILSAREKLNPDIADIVTFIGFHPLIRKGSSVTVKPGADKMSAEVIVTSPVNSRVPIKFEIGLPNVVSKKLFRVDIKTGEAGIPFLRLPVRDESVAGLTEKLRPVLDKLGREDVLAFFGWDANTPEARKVISVLEEVREDKQDLADTALMALVQAELNGLKVISADRGDKVQAAEPKEERVRMHFAPRFKDDIAMIEIWPARPPEMKLNYLGPLYDARVIFANEKVIIIKDRRVYSEKLGKGNEMLFGALWRIIVEVHKDLLRGINSDAKLTWRRPQFPDEKANYTVTIKDEPQTRAEDPASPDGQSVLYSNDIYGATHLTLRGGQSLGVLPASEILTQYLDGIPARFYCEKRGNDWPLVEVVVESAYNPYLNFILRMERFGGLDDRPIAVTTEFSWGEKFTVRAGEDNLSDVVQEALQKASLNQLWNLTVEGPGEKLDHLTSIFKEVPSNELRNALIGMWLTLEADGHTPEVVLDSKNSMAIFLTGTNKYGIAVSWWEYKRDPSLGRWDDELLYKVATLPAVIRRQLEDVREAGVIENLFHKGEHRVEAFWKEVAPAALDFSRTDKGAKSGIVSSGIKTIPHLLERFNEMVDKRYTRKVETSASRASANTKPGKSPEDALKVIALSKLLQEGVSFTIREYLAAYIKVSKAYPDLKLDKLALNPKSTARRDLNELVKRGILTKEKSAKGRNIYCLTEEGKKEAGALREDITAPISEPASGNIEDIKKVPGVTVTEMTAEEAIARVVDGSKSGHIDNIYFGEPVLQQMDDQWLFGSGARGERDYSNPQALRSRVNKVAKDGKVFVIEDEFENGKATNIGISGSVDEVNETLDTISASTARAPVSGELVHSSQLPVVSQSKEHPLIQVISEYVVPLGLGKGPGVTKMSEKELTDMYRAITRRHDEGIQVEVIVPNSIGISGTMNRALRDTNNMYMSGARKNGENNAREIVKHRIYSDEANLETILKERPEPGVKRIVITDKDPKDVDGRERIMKLVEKNADLFKDTRVLNVLMPGNYKSLKEDGKTFHQTRLMMIAELACLLKSGDDIGKIALKAMLDGYIISSKINESVNLDDFVENLIKPESGDWTTAARIKYFLGATVSLLPKLVKDFELLKLRMKTFRIAA